jgi:hypothetical protein
MFGYRIAGLGGYTRAPKEIVIIDSYTEANHSADHGLDAGSNGQAITLASNTTITSITYYLKRSGSPTGNAFVELYATTGTVGTDANKTGGVLATSDGVANSSISTSSELVEFTFTPGYDASAGDICILTATSVAYTGSRLFNGYDSSSPTHGGNYIEGPSPDSGADCIFYLRGYLT